MRTKLIKSLVIILGVIISIGMVAACGKKDDEPIDSGKPPIKIIEGKYILKDGSSEYKILLPDQDNIGEYDRQAATEFNYFFEESTGVKLDIITEDEPADGGYNKVISIGNTSARRNEQIADTSDLKMSGFAMKTVGESIILTGNTKGDGYGPVYAAYELLEYLVGYHYYAEDSYKLDKNVSEVPLIDVNLAKTAAIDVLRIGYRNISNNTSVTQRLKSEGGANQKNTFIAGYSAHSMLDILPYSTYKSNTDWYAPNGTALNYSNVEMQKEFAQRVKALLRSDTDGTVMHFGHPDNPSKCTCDDCNTLIRDKTMNDAGLELWFVNQISDLVTPWLEQTMPGREILFTFFAYQYSEQPPVVYNEQTGDYSPFSDSVIPRDNVGVFFAPIGLDYSIPMDEPGTNNYATYNNLMGWYSLFGKNKIIVWDYGTNYYGYLYNFYNWNSMAANYRIYAEVGVNYIFHQCVSRSASTQMEEMRAYIWSRLAWDPYQNPLDIAREFCDYYYGDAGAIMYEYLSITNAWWERLIQDKGVRGTVYFELTIPDYWPYGLVQNFYDYFDRAEAAISKYKYSDPEYFEQLTLRLRKDRLLPDYLMITFYQGYLPEHELNFLLEEFKFYVNHFGILGPSQYENWSW